MTRTISIIILFFTFCIYQKAYSQGCVAIKGTAGVCSRPSDAQGWDLNINNRYFKSYKHFVGTEEKKQRGEEGPNVKNYPYDLALTATRRFNPAWSLPITLPILRFA